MLKISAFHLEKLKSSIPKKKFQAVVNIKNKKALLTDQIFSEGFDQLFLVLAQDFYAPLAL